uniref:Uncharacterized protein n=1 Tax=Utricularia reniformis TaxID=192314 RepID=A0A1Y0B251_9LAMI|nr:hypothetical protein AEK19_MT1260 [Utricularia reniformis]ART31468.1 hypothetical protein AEK19_MT1260 [Utricularia reniformis]
MKDEFGRLGERCICLNDERVAGTLPCASFRRIRNISIWREEKKILGYLIKSNLFPDGSHFSATPTIKKAFHIVCINYCSFPKMKVI